MKITPVTTKRVLLLPAAAVLTCSTVMMSCHQQQPQSPPGAPPASFTADVAAASAKCTIPGPVRSDEKGRQRLAGKMQAP